MPAEAQKEDYLRLLCDDFALFADAADGRCFNLVPAPEGGWDLSVTKNGATANHSKHETAEAAYRTWLELIHQNKHARISAVSGKHARKWLKLRRSGIDEISKFLFAISAIVFLTIAVAVNVMGGLKTTACALLLLLMGFSLWMFAYPVTMFVIAAMVFAWRLRPQKLEVRQLLAVVPLMMTGSLLLVGGLCFAHEPASGEARVVSSLSELLLGVAMYLPIVWWLGLVGIARGYRWFTLAVGMLHVWLHLGASFCCAMAIQNMWL